MSLLEELHFPEPVRMGMYKNFRVGVVKYYDKGKEGKPDHILMEIIEFCHGADGDYFSSYNLLIEVDKKFAQELSNSSVGRWALVGFYIQSFYEEAEDRFTTSLKIRFYKELDSVEVVRIEIRNSRIKNQQGIRYHNVPEPAFKEMKEITNQTKYSEYGTR